MSLAPCKSFSFGDNPLRREHVEAVPTRPNHKPSLATETFMRKLCPITCLAGSVVLAACSSSSNSSSSGGGSGPIVLPSATVSDEQVRGQWPATRPSVIYVGDFQLEAAVQPTDATQGTQTRLIHLGMLRDLGKSPEQAAMQRAAQVKDDFEQAIVDT
jgi:hypothetical protein